MREKFQKQCGNTFLPINPTKIPENSTQNFLKFANSLWVRRTISLLPSVNSIFTFIFTVENVPLKLGHRQSAKQFKDSVVPLLFW